MASESHLQSVIKFLSLGVIYLIDARGAIQIHTHLNDQLYQCRSVENC